MFFACWVNGVSFSICLAKKQKGPSVGIMCEVLKRNSGLLFGESATASNLIVMIGSALVPVQGKKAPLGADRDKIWRKKNPMGFSPQQLEKLGVLPIKLRCFFLGGGQPESWQQVLQGTVKT